MAGLDFQRNNLAEAASPYLRQHAANPVWWQEWRSDVLQYARSAGLPLFVSVGYAACHWCHVMAAEAFSDAAAAAKLNSGFVSIKVDREERPDIDRYLMDFMVDHYGQGGWPLNVFMSPALEPFAAASYTPLEARYGRPGFPRLLELASEFYRDKRGLLRAYRREAAPASGPERRGSDELSFLSHPRRLLDDPVVAGHLGELERAHDPEYGGFGTDAKFPPHSSMLYLLYLASAASGPEREKLRALIEPTLDAMQAGGLHDHLQGGFFRYCVDRAWERPHFEKMLYDQALQLWVYSLAARVLERSDYERTARGVLRCLTDSFKLDGLYLAAHDADTGHEEGAGYTWRPSEIEGLLRGDQLEVFRKVFGLARGGADEKCHLVDTRAVLSDGERAAYEGARALLLAERRRRPQPELDRTAMTSWNGLVGVALIQAWRMLGERSALDEAGRLLDELVERHLRDGRLAHSSVGARLNTTQYLEDTAALLLFAGYVHEEDRSRAGLLARLEERLKLFRGSGRWIESRNDDFVEVPAESFDSPLPSSEALAEAALLRARALTGRDWASSYPGRPLAQDFKNLVWLMGSGAFALVGAPELLAWDGLPAATLQVPGERLTTCRWGRCSEGLELRRP